jgi:2-methylisocitrate lyase-like PEP mutase family enzyme
VPPVSELNRLGVRRVSVGCGPYRHAYGSWKRQRPSCSSGEPTTRSPPHICHIQMSSSY